MKLVLEINREVKTRLETLQRRINADGLVVVVRKALAVYDACIQAIDAKKTIIFRTEDGTEQIFKVEE